MKAIIFTIIQGEKETRLRVISMAQFEIVSTYCKAHNLKYVYEYADMPDKLSGCKYEKVEDVFIDRPIEIVPDLHKKKLVGVEIAAFMSAHANEKGGFDTEAAAEKYEIMVCDWCRGQNYYAVGHLEMEDGRHYPRFGTYS